VDTSQRHPFILSDLAVFYADVGRHPDVTRLVEELQERAQTAHVPALSVGTILAAANRAEDAWPWIARAYREHEPLPLWNCWPLLPAALAEDSRFIAILKRAGLEPRQWRSRS
jgi:hypothetical protein